jgi:alpha-tubulin suppressor-like RCC1 family protein
MKNKETLLILLISTLLISIACSLIGGQPQSQEPTSSIYATVITAGGGHACALLNDGRVKCWGANDSGQLGDGTYTSSNIPVEVSGLTDVAAISAGGSHTCALLVSGEVKCWGYNNTGQLGDGTKAMNAKPVSVVGLTNAIAISAGANHTCAITEEDGAKCWGKNIYGMVGDGSITRTILTPVDVVGLTNNVLSISAGSEHTCAVTNNGSVKCWGRNDYGQVGDNTTGAIRKKPTDVATLNKGIKSVSTGFSTSCALTESNNVLCWGWIGLEDNYTSPHEVTGLDRNITAVTVGGDHICGLTSEGTVKCLGENEYGQLGTNATNPIYTAKSISGLPAVRAIAANSNYTCALISNGKVFCWGQNTSGQLGNGTNKDSAKPVEVIDLIQ